MKAVDIFEQLERVRQELEQEKRFRQQWQEKYYELLKENKELKSKLNQFLNANTPSSKLPPQFKPTFNPRPEKGTNPRGKPEGSNGATKEQPDHVDKKIKAQIGKSCKKCKGKLQKSSYIRYFYEIPKIKVAVTECEVEEGYCQHCNLLYTGTHPELPAEGMMGVNLQAFFTELRHNFAGSYERTAGFFESLTGFSFSQTAVNDCVSRVAGQLEPSYKKFEEQLSTVEYAHSDETGWPVNGEQWWLWLFVTAKFVFITVRNSRARKVLTDLFGEFFGGVIVSDCLNVYQKFAAAFAKDWVHLLRKTHFEADKFPNRNVVRLHRELSSMYAEVEAFVSGSPSFEERVWASVLYHQKLQRIANFCWRSEPAQSVVDDWLRKFEGQWLVPVIMPNVSLTNNVDERGIRKVIPVRKLLGGHRTEKGAMDFAIIETHRQTWKLNGESPYRMLVQHLRAVNVKAAA